jgi:CRP-like cAMP-binding protein/serine/threonine protein phosphatase PrpC
MDFEVAYPQSFIQANEQLHKSRIDDTMSGTTCIGMCIKDGWLEIANCGDSRAIIASEEDTGRKKSVKLIARPLSIDQTPFRKDERERVKKSGARVMTMDQLDGLEPIHENWGLNLGEEIDDSGDPPRIWAQDGDYPGTAFTRSIGDSVSERLGVFADPEMGREQLTAQDKFIVVASDGVFEFLTSQAVVDMVCKYTDTLSASRAVVEESYQLWLQYEVRTDDITMICIFLESVLNGADAPRKSTAQGPTKEKQMRPVRANLSRAKRRSIVRAAEDETEEEYIITDHIVKKTPEEEARIDAAVKTNFLFQHLGQQQRDEVFSVMAKVQPKAGDVIMKQGDDGDKFYVVDSGKYEVRISSAPPTGSNLGDVVHNYGEGGHFGELALMYAKPRAASIVCTQAGTLWSLDRAAFRAILMRSDASSLKKTLRKVDVLKGLTYTQVERLIETMSERTFRDGEVIIKQGDMGDTFYIVTEGAGVCTIKTDGTEKEVLQLQQYDYFGERALLSDAPRAASVKAIGKTKCLHINREAFEDVLGPLERIIDQV